MITIYSTDYRTQLCEFFSRIIESHKAYISHGELQMGIALDSNELAPNYKEIWLKYLDRQVVTRTILSCSTWKAKQSSVLYYLASRMTEPLLTGLFLISVSILHTGENVSVRNYYKEQPRVSGQMEYKIVTSNQVSTIILLINSSSITVSNRYRYFPIKIV